MRNLRLALKSAARFSFIAAAAGLLASCGSAGAFGVARANRLYRDGYAHEAAALYLEAGAGTEPIASYNLANVFASLGEKAPARAMYETAMELGGSGLAARAWYNIGAAEYSAGAYAGAAAAFRKALEAYASAEPERGLGFELSRAYELAVKAEAERRDAGAAERARYGAGAADGASQPFSLSRTDEKTLFVPGGDGAGEAEDH